MRHAEARAEIETGSAAVWTATPVAFENVAFEPPADGSAWVRLTVVNGGSQLASIGGPPRRFRSWGRVVLDITSAAGTGSRSAVELADQAIDLFAAWPVSELVLFPGALEPSVQLADTYRTTVAVPFRHDDLR